jgi:hypothetical protein
MNGSIDCHEWLATMSGDVDEYTSRHDAFLPCLNATPPGSVHPDLIVGGMPVPHAIAIPRVAEGVDVCDGLSVERGPDEILRQTSAAGLIDSLHEVLGWMFVPGGRERRPLATERDHTTCLN